MNFAEGFEGGNGFGLSLVGEDAYANWVYGNYIGLRLDGSTAAGNGGGGIWIDPDAGYNRIGTDADGTDDVYERNVI